MLEHKGSLQFISRGIYIFSHYTMDLYANICACGNISLTSPYIFDQLVALEKSQEFGTIDKPCCYGHIIDIFYY